MTSAIVLGGGRASRLGGADKASIDIGGRMLLDHVLAAVADCRPIIVVGPEHLARPSVTVVREDPPFGGPVAGIAVALDALADEAPAETWLLACDLPRAADIVELLRPIAIPDGADAVILADEDGRQQWLAGRYSIAALRAAAAALPTARDASMRSLTGGIRTHLVTDRTGASIDLDTWSAIDDYRSTRKDSHA